MDFFRDMSDMFGSGAGFPYSGFARYPGMFNRNFQPQRRRTYPMEQLEDYDDYPQNFQPQRRRHYPVEQFEGYDYPQYRQRHRRPSQQYHHPQDHQQQQQVPQQVRQEKRPQQRQGEPVKSTTRVIPVKEVKVWKAPPKDLTQDEAAKRIQKAARGLCIRRAKVLDSLRKIAEARRQLEGFRVQVDDAEQMKLVKENFKERVKLTEGVMKLLLELDSIHGPPVVREIRKATVRQIVQLQERIDGLLQQKEAEAAGSDGKVEAEELSTQEIWSTDGKLEPDPDSESAERQEQKESELHMDTEKCTSQSSELEHKMEAEQKIEPEKQLEAQEMETEQKDNEQKAQLDAQGMALEQKEVEEKDQEPKADLKEQLTTQEMVLEQKNMELKDEQPKAEQLDAQETAAQREGTEAEQQMDAEEAALDRQVHQQQPDQVVGDEPDQLVVDQQEAEQRMDFVEDHQQQADHIVGDEPEQLVADQLEAEQRKDLVEDAQQKADVQAEEYEVVSDVDDEVTRDGEVDDMQAQTLELVERMERALGTSEQQQQDCSMTDQQEAQGEQRNEDVVVDKEVVSASRKREREEESKDNETKKMMAQLASDNQQLKLLVAECLRQVNKQSVMVNQLNDRVQKLEKKVKKSKQRRTV